MRRTPAHDFFRLREASPLWTAPAFDRCLLIALLYPIVTVILFWVVSGHVGPAEKALLLPERISDGRRYLAGLLILIAWFLPVLAGAGRFRRMSPTLVGVGVGAITVAGVVAGAVAVAVARVSVGVGAGVVGIVIVGGSAGVGGVVGVSAGAGTVAGMGAVAGAAKFLYDRALDGGWQGSFLLGFVPIAALVFALSPALLAGLKTWDLNGPLLLFLGLLTIVNAPFDWASLGLTRALLHKGLELGGWWPLLLALLDAALAAVIIAALAVAMVVSVQAFDDLAALTAGPRAITLPLDKLFAGIKANPGAPEYWWAYALLLSTMIPSLANLMIGGASLARGIPIIPRLLLAYMQEGKVLVWDRVWIALVLTAQNAGGAFLGALAQVVVVILMVVYVMPWLGFGLLDLAQSVAELDFPMRIIELF